MVFRCQHFDVRCLLTVLPPITLRYLLTVLPPITLRCLLTVLPPITLRHEQHRRPLCNANANNITPIFNSANRSNSSSRSSKMDHFTPT
jgi:hypothetical protein